MINCRKVLETLSDYLDDDVALATRRDLETHLAECRTCQVIYDTARRTLRIVTDVGSFEIPTEVSDRLLQATMAGLDAASRGDTADDVVPGDATQTDAPLSGKPRRRPS